MTARVLLAGAILGCLVAGSAWAQEALAGAVSNPGSEAAELERAPGLQAAAPPTHVAATEAPAEREQEEEKEEEEEEAPAPELEVSVPAALRLVAQRSSPLALPQGDEAVSPVEGRLRIQPQARVAGVAAFAEADVLGGTITSEPPPRSPRQRFHPLVVRQLGLGYQGDLFRARVGQQGWTWGLGLVTNAGDRALAAGEELGEPRFGDLAYRGELALTPKLGRGRVEACLGGELIATDDQVEMETGERATRVTFSLRFLETDASELGLYGAYRHQQEADGATADTWLLDAAGRRHWAAGPGTAGLAFELASVVGKRQAPEALRRVFQLGALVRGSFRLRGLTAYLDLGFASGDEDPADGVERAFRFDRDLHAGVLLFQEHLGFASGSAPYGAIEGAAYVFPRLAWSSGGAFSLYGGPLVAISAGAPDRPRGSVLGTELDVGVQLEGRPLPRVRLSSALEGGVLIPAGRDGRESAPESLVRLRLAASL